MFARFKVFFNRLAEHHPIEQGLRQNSSYPVALSSARLAEHHPIEQGLRQHFFGFLVDVDVGSQSIIQ